MKKIIALILVLCMSFGMIVSVSAASPFAQRLNLVRLIRSMFSSNDDGYGIGELEDGVLTVYVSVDGKKDANGTEKNPYATIEAARDAIRGIDKSELDGITVIVGSGMYSISETITLTAEDAGTKSCPITYRGEDGAIISGGTAFDYTEFVKASGATLELFPEEVRDKLVMIDLGKFGYTPADIAKKLQSDEYYDEAELILVNGEQMDLARYPNVDEGWIEIEGGHFLDKNGNYTENDGNNGGEDAAVQTIIEYGDEHMERVLSWANREDLFVFGHYKFVWCKDHTEVTKLYEDSDTMLLPFSGGYFPREGGIFYFYNIPEELDVPGEFFIDDNAMLYYYPKEGFETAHFTIPLLNASIMDIADADYLTFDNLTFESSLRKGITFNADNLTFTGCTVQGVYNTAVDGDGVNITFVGNEIAHVGKGGVVINGGDEATLTKSNNLICNNYVHDWCTRSTMAYGVDIGGCGATICHNEVSDSKDLGLCAKGPLNMVEYNYLNNTCQFFCDGGTLAIQGNAYGTTIRYNVVMNTGYESPLDIVGVQGITADMAALGSDYYGNIVYNCTGHGMSLAYSRDSMVVNNLMIKCGRSAFQAVCPGFADHYREDVASEDDIAEYLLSDIWQTTFPELVGIHASYDPDNAFDPMFKEAPANNVVKDNYFFFDRYFRTWHEDGAYKTDLMMDIEDHYYTLSEMEVPSTENGKLTIYNSKRNKNPITFAEALATANAAVGTVMTEEQLNEVGRIDVDYGIGDMLVQ